MANDDNTRPRATGGCLCGSVRFEVRGPLRDVVICHCVFCQRMHTHVGAATACAPSDLRIISGRTLRWYRSSPGRRRGFCRKCGSSLFWEPMPTTHISISAGSLDRPTGLKVVEHIFLAQKGDYYEVDWAKDRVPAPQSGPPFP
jgi:hypothetical protein